MTILIRGENPSDHAAIRCVMTAAFRQAEEADLVDALRRDGDAVLTLVALVDGRVVGHALFSRLSAPMGALALAPVAVLPERQGRGVGSALIRAGLARAAAAGWEAVFVVGDPGYYRRFGFSTALAAGFSSPYAGPHFMATATRGALSITTGRVAYAPAFGQLT